ncbi:MAG: CHAT domain-containing protein [Candidatus Competibacteraceae bacterium]
MPTTLLLQASDVRDPAHWYWRLTDTNGNFLADHTVALDRADWRYEAFCDLYGYLNRRVAPDKRQAEETRLLAELGAWIGEQVLGPIAPALVNQAPVTVRVQIPADSPAAAGLCYLPLELAYTGGKPLAVQEVSLIFEVGKPAPVKLQPVGDRLRVLAVFSLPTGASTLNLRQERYRLKTLLQSLVTSGWAIDLRVLQYGVTRKALGDMLAEGDGWDLVHFSGHGQAAELVLEHPDGRPDTVSSADLVKLLRPGRGRLKWVTLSACLSAAVTVEETLRWLGLEPTRRFGESASDGATAAAEPLPALAQTLVENLNCAVLAMRYPVGDAFAIELGERLYRCVLQNGQALTRALQLALPETLTAVECSPLAAVTPAWFGSAAVNLSLRAPRRTETSFKPPVTGLAAFPDEPPLFVGRVGVLAQASQALAPASGRSGVLFYGMAGAGKSYCALELAYHYEGLPRFQGYVWYQAPELDKDISPALLNFAMAMEQQLPGFTMVQVVDDVQKLEAFLPRLTELLERSGILIVLDNLESLLRPEGQWRDERWGKLLAALLNHRGFSRVILTSRIRPVIPGLYANAVLELPIHALSLDEAALLIRQLPNLGRLLRGEGVTDGRQREHQRQVVLEALRLVQGHPKLLDLADKQAVDLATLEQQLSRAGQTWSAGRGRLDAFFQQGESALADTDFLRVLADWTDLVAATLPAAAQDLFHFLCCLEESDRRGGIVETNWPKLWRRLERAGDPPALDASLVALTTAGLVAADMPATDDPTASAQFYRLHPGVAEAGRRRAGEAFQTAVDTELAAFWRAVYDHAVQQEMQGAGGLLVHAGRAAAPYLLRQRR